MNATINISLPKKMLEDAKQAVDSRGFSSLSEFIRNTLREVLYVKDGNKITENGFPVWFEDKVLESAKKPHKNDVVLETDEDIHNFFLHLKTPTKK